MRKGGGNQITQKFISRAMIWGDNFAERPPLTRRDTTTDSPTYLRRETKQRKSSPEAPPNHHAFIENVFERTQVKFLKRGNFAADAKNRRLGKYCLGPPRNQAESGKTFFSAMTHSSERTNPTPGKAASQR